MTGAATEAETLILPTRLLLQVREGKLNVLTEGTITSVAQYPAEDEDGRIDHTVPKADVVILIARALRKEIREWREAKQPAGDLAEVEEYLEKLQAWIFDPPTPPTA